MTVTTHHAAPHRSVRQRMIRPASHGRTRVLALLIVGWLLASLAACGGSTPTAPAPTATSPAHASATPPPPTPTPDFASPRVSAGAIVWTGALDPATGAPLERATEFPPDALHIYAAVPLRHVEAGTRLRIDWRYNDTPMQALARDAVARQTANDVWVTFALTRDDGQVWPVGVYEAIVSIDGREALRSVARVEMPPGD